MNIDYIVHQIRTEIKVDKEGKGVCSIRGAARLADVSESSIRRALEGAVLEPSKMATFLIGQGFEGAVLEIFNQTGIPDMVVGAILEYYAFEAGRYCNEQAKLVYRAFARIGIRAWMQDISGYQKPIEQPLDIREFVIKQLPATPKKWETKYKPEFWLALENLYGLKQGQWACSGFIQTWIYDYFPKEVMERVNEVNSSRKNRIHQHFTDTLEKALDMQISLVICNLIKAKNKYHFKRLMKAAKRYKFTETNLKALQGESNGKA
jgi:hypothetical protein